MASRCGKGQNMPQLTDLEPGKDKVIWEFIGTVLLSWNADVDEDGSPLDLLERLVLEVPLKRQKYLDFCFLRFFVTSVALQV